MTKTRTKTLTKMQTRTRSRSRTQTRLDQRRIEQIRLGQGRVHQTRLDKLKPENVENILADDFIGHFNASRTWDKESHFNFLSDNTTVQDTISGQIAEGNWVATSFHRSATLDGKAVKADLMQFKRFENGKIAEIFEYTDPGQWEDQEDKLTIKYS